VQEDKGGKEVGRFLMAFYGFNWLYLSFSFLILQFFDSSISIFFGQKMARIIQRFLANI